MKEGIGVGSRLKVGCNFLIVTFHLCDESCFTFTNPGRSSINKYVVDLVSFLHNRWGRISHGKQIFTHQQQKCVFDLGYWWTNVMRGIGWMGCKQ